MKTTLSIITLLLACTATMAQTATSTNATASIKVRGTDAGKVKPLFVIYANKVEIKRLEQADTTALKTLNPQDIESINVLKGESASKKYAWEGANGVVEIYLKEGKYPSDYKKSEIKKD